MDAMTPVERGLNQGREGFIGWMGLGGSIFQWHPELEIGFALFLPRCTFSIWSMSEEGLSSRGASLSERLIPRLVIISVLRQCADSVQSSGATDLKTDAWEVNGNGPCNRVFSFDNDCVLGPSL